MKNLLVPIIILVFIFSLITFNLIFLKKTTTELSNILEKAKTAADQDNYKECETYLNKFTNRYEDYDGFYTIVIRHIELDEIKTYTEKAVEYSKTGEKGMATGEISALIALVEHLYEIEQINLYNVV
jgi:hypothetical protein